MNRWATRCHWFRVRKTTTKLQNERCCQKFYNSFLSCDSKRKNIRNNSWLWIRVSGFILLHSSEIFLIAHLFILTVGICSVNSTSRALLGHQLTILSQWFQTVLYFINNCLFLINFCFIYISRTESMKSIFLILYKEMYFRHIYASIQVNDLFYFILF